MAAKRAFKDSLLADRSDDELVELARRTGNDDGAYEELYRRHETGARNVARHIVRSRHDADDVVNEAFDGVISAINHGAGPRSNFRQYLMACVRNSCKSRRWYARSISTDPSLLELNAPVFEDPERLSEAGLVASAFSSLSPDWQQTLWMSAVEERPATEIAECLGRRPAAVAALAHRAREAFAEAYLAQHQTRTTDPACARISPKLAHYVRGRSGEVDNIIVEQHLAECVACNCAADELRDINSSLRTLTGPAPLAGIGAAAGGAATMVGFLPLATAGGGFGFGAVGTAAVAKVAALGALLVPAALVVAHAAPTPRALPTAAAASSVTEIVHHTSTTAGSGVKVTNPADNVTTLFTSVPISAMDGGDGVIVPAPEGQPLAPATAASSVVPSTSNGGGSASSTGDLATPTTATPSTPLLPISVPDLPVVSLPAAPAGTPIAGPAATLPLGGAAAAGVSVGPGGISVGVNVTVPVVTLPINLTVDVPPISTPAINVPSVTLVPSISTPAITTPPLAVPGVVLPDLGLGLPVISTPTITVPSLGIPSVSLPAIELPSIEVPSITLPQLPPITIPPIVDDLLGGLGLNGLLTTPTTVPG
jgi:RNA polymerase sigma factor (sigma-70 family)